MKALVECLITWLEAEPSELKAWRILNTMARETLKVSNSADAEQRDFEVLDIAQACEPNQVWEYDQAKRWFNSAGPVKYLEARRAKLENYFENHGHSQALSLVQRKSSGRHRAPWYFVKYDVAKEKSSDIAASASPSNATNTGTKVVEPDITYEVTKPGDIQLNWLGWVLLGKGAFVTRSGRGVLWAAMMLASIVPFFSCMYLLFAMRSFNRPLQTSDVVLMLGLMAMGWLYWRFFIRPWVWLIDDRVVLSGYIFTALKEDPVQLDMAKDEIHRYVRLVRYSAICPICAGNIELRYGNGPHSRRIFGCCSEVPHEHVFTFDRVTRMGQKYLA